MSDATYTTVESIENIEAGDVLVVERKGQVVADNVEVTEIKTCGFSGVSEPQTDDEIEFGSSLHDLLTEALGDNSQFVDDFEVYTVEQTSTDDEDGADIVTDGGEDTTDDISDDEITASIERHDDPDHPEGATVEEVRDVLARINDDVLDYWAEHQDAIDDGALDIVHEDRDSIVLADRSGHFWSEQYDALGIDDGPLRTIISAVHHKRARARCDHSWSAVDPVVVRKTAAFRAGEQQVLREIARRTTELGSVARAVDTLAVETHGWSKGNWARLTDRNPSTVTRMTDN